MKPVNATRERLTAALALFNERGSAHVTTNHIAAQAGLSPGNLYYWFRDKQEIIRTLVQQWLAEVEEHVAEAHDQPAHVHALWEDLSRTAELEHRHRFIRRELVGLMYDDPELARLYRETYGRRLAAQVAYVRRLVAAGVLLPPEPPRTLDDLVVALWLVAEYWPMHCTLLTDEVDRRPSSGIRPMLTVLEPYLTESGLRSLEAL